ncbi:hypothetical protein BH09MYX1_BH09MYX1_16940 [soil metagenome]
MSSDPNKKSTRQFQCRDVLWETFEQMARELECSVDYLINEAMKQYARQRSYGPGATRTPFPSQAPREAYPQPPEPRASTFTGPLSTSPSMQLPQQPMRGGGGLPSPPTGRMPLPPPNRPSSSGLPMPPPRGMPQSSPISPPAGRISSLPTPPPPMSRESRPPPPAPSRSVPPPIPGGQPRGGGGGGYNGNAYAQAPAAQLSVIYQGERTSVTKERFVIGRGKQSSDLTLKDPNVSRQHAMVEFQNGVYFMVDMGSTNGVEYNCQRIARKQIAEGDTFRICDHEVRFTYR